MTGRTNSSMEMNMVRWGFLMLCTIVASLTATAAVHAGEFSSSFTTSATTIECSGYVHSDGDQDQSQGDADGSLPHHHGGCHGVASLVSARSIVPILFDLRSAPAVFVDSTALGRWSPGPDLRPPIA